ncbi:hypothetical protein N7471_003610 [Penicillium samsonianum]|uniref:uncharacterized protein n=1 Tax=Penicillium samsonianum TaxID=1882272 RepID=UPI002547D2E1|nr:uncharacterized protein N7471_003610 [Penicillium samsonianum]KAJ6137124.1 hypothetical protein N7471_003610 [Penicillium samsonianum]
MTTGLTFLVTLFLPFPPTTITNRIHPSWLVQPSITPILLTNLGTKNAELSSKRGQRNLTDFVRITTVTDAESVIPPPPPSPGNSKPVSLDMVSPSVAMDAHSAIAPPPPSARNSYPVPVDLMSPTDDKSIQSKREHIVHTSLE